MTSDTAARPAPMPDADSAFFWSALGEHRLVLQRCTDCEKPRFPTMPTCPYCTAPDHDLVDMSGAGSVYSWIVVHRAFDPAFEPDVPYTVATIELAEGPRMVARLDGAESVEVGLGVKAAFVDHDGWTELRFVPAE